MLSSHWESPIRISHHRETLYHCASYGGEDDYVEGSEQDDLEQVNALLLRLSLDEQQRSTTERSLLDGSTADRIGLLAYCSSAGYEVTEA